MYNNKRHFTSSSFRRPSGKFGLSLTCLFRVLFLCRVLEWMLLSNKRIWNKNKKKHKE